MKRYRRVPSRPRAARALGLRDRMLVALTEKSTLLQVVEATHGVRSWASWARESSAADMREGLALIDEESGRLDERLRHLRTRAAGAADDLARASTEAECDRLVRRLQELVDQREQLELLAGRLRADAASNTEGVEVEAIEWQRPLVLGDGSVAGFVDLWATLRVTYYRIVRGNDGGDHERRPRYEGYSSQHLSRSYMVSVAPAIRSLSETVRRIRFAQAHAREALPLLVTCTPLAPELLAGQGIPTFVWSPDGGASAAPGTSLATRRVRRVAPEPAGPAPSASPPRLPSPRPSLPPARSPGTTS